MKTHGAIMHGVTTGINAATSAGAVPARLEAL